MAALFKMSNHLAVPNHFLKILDLKNNGIENKKEINRVFFSFIGVDYLRSLVQIMPLRVPRF